MTIVDTSIWVDHYKGKDTPLSDLLIQQQAVLHPFVHGELLLGGLPQGASRDLGDLPAIAPASSAEVAAAIEWFKLAGAGIGYVDAHLLVSARLMEGGRVLTSDRNLRLQAERLGLAHA